MLDKEHSNARNSENTTLFLVSCYQYILSAIVMNVGPPFRQSMATNRKRLPTDSSDTPAVTNTTTVPFVITMVVALLASSYMLFDPAQWLYKLMQLTDMSLNFKIFILVLAIGGFLCSYLAERFAFPRLARLVGRMKARLRPNKQKKRKQYKVIQEAMRI